jgi:uncharacterized repeat protein (TIGR01451 family)
VLSALAIQLLLPGGHALALPVVSAFSPSQGKPGTQIVLIGSGFSSATSVQFDIALADFTVTSDTRMVATVPVDATTGPLRVTNPTGTGNSTATFLVAPRLTGFSPLRGAPTSTVTLKGFNFTGATNVLFNDKPAPFAVTAPSQIQATVPTGATNGPITVQTPAGTTISSGAFTVTGPAPIIDDFSPHVGAPGAGVLIRGANFNNPVTVEFNGVVDPTAISTATTQINAHVPTNAATGRITVVTAGGATTNSDSFFVTRAPVITNFFPGRGQAFYTMVTIEGINFSGITGVGFNGKSVSSFSIPAENQITVNVPAGATTGRITVTNSFGVGTSTNDFIITNAPIIDRFNPVLGAPGTFVTISGVNLSNGPTVLKFGAVTASFVVTGQNGTQIQATVPNGADTGPITMTNAYGTFITSSNFFVPGSVPYVHDLSPATGPRGTSVIITGGNFNNPVTVSFNGVTSSDATVVALTQVQATVPATATTGPLSVTSSAGTSTNNPVFYLPPRLAGFSPASGVVGGTVVLSGLNFTGAASLLFNTAGAGFNVTASNSISAVIPADATTGPLTVIAPAGVIISTNNFRVLPNITGFSPQLGPVGTQVTVLGTSFLNVSDVSFNNTHATNFTVVSSTEVRATVPAGASTGPLRISTPDGTAVSTASFTVTGPSDLNLELQSSSYLMPPGQPLTYTVYALNKGPSTVTGAVLSDALPSGVELVSITSTTTNCTVANNVVSCAIPLFPPQTLHKLVIVVIPHLEGVLFDSASIAAVEPELAPGDNFGLVATTVVSDASRTLRINTVPNSPNVVISWPTSAVPFSLDISRTFSSSNPWQPFTNNTPAVLNGRNTVTNDASIGTGFFRLRKL